MELVTKTQDVLLGKGNLRLQRIAEIYTPCLHRHIRHTTHQYYFIFTGIHFVVCILPVSLCVQFPPVIITLVAKIEK